jgi:hypothetical protein
MGLGWILGGWRSEKSRSERLTRRGHLRDPLIGGATWADGDVIFFDNISPVGRGGGGISMVAAGGGRSESVARPDMSKGRFSLRLPHALPGGKALLMTVTASSQLGDAKIAVWPLATGKQVVLTDGSDAGYVATGHLVFVRPGRCLRPPLT